MSDQYEYAERHEGFDKSRPHGWIQWKGTEVCMDVRCACGAEFHVDADFFYHAHCLACDRVYSVGSRVALVEMPPEFRQSALDGSCLDLDPNDNVACPVRPAIPVDAKLAALAAAVKAAEREMTKARTWQAEETLDDAYRILAQFVVARVPEREEPL